jgi:hypothetical protein
MRRKRLSVCFALLIMAVAGFLMTDVAAGQELTTLHNFGNGTDASGPWGGLVADAAGNLYGTTLNGGLYGNGSVFELQRTGAGSLAEKVLHSFNVNVGTGEGYPSGSLVIDRQGDLYGTTQVGNNGFGTVYELQPGSGGTWTEKVLFGFSVGSGYLPYSGVIADPAGNLYGTTLYTGNNGRGTVWELKRGAGGTWTHQVLNNFHDNNIDGYYPFGGVARDASGHLYGTTGFGGTGLGGWGVAYELTPGKPQWTETILHNFTLGIDGAEPSGTVILDAAGNVYGTTTGGDGSGYPDGDGVVFRLSPAGDGTWRDTFLYVFQNNGVDGYGANGNLGFDSAGNLYGTTAYGGPYTFGVTNSGGTAFKLTPTAEGLWSETILHSFGNGTDGLIPMSGLIFADGGLLYGTTAGGGIYGDGAGSAGFGGIAFSIAP